jgi:hypothetical protein
MSYIPKPYVMAPGERVTDIVLALLILAGIAFVTIRQAVARRQLIAFYVKWFIPRFALAMIASLVLGWVMVSVGCKVWWVHPLALAISLPLMLPIPTFKPSRKIPQHIRQAVIQKYEERTGKSFDPATEEIDHMVPFSKGGGHTKDNLWVVTKKFNRGKGNNMPLFQDWVRFTFRR